MLKMTTASGFGWLKGQVRAWLNDLRHFTTILVFQFFWLRSLPKLSFKTAQYGSENTRSVKRASINFRLFDYNDIISSNKKERLCVLKEKLRN